MTKIVVLAAAVAVVGPTAYFIVVQQGSNQIQSNPYDYVPAGSSFVVQGHFNSTQIYAFMNNGSIGAVLPLTVSDLQLLVNSTQNNSSAAMTISQYNTYDSQQVYRISNLDLSYLAGNSYIPVPEFFSFTTSLPALLNGTVYASDAGTSMMVAGNLSAVENSISASRSGNTFIGTGSQYMDDTSNYSFYYAPSNFSSVKSISGNVSNGYTHVFVALSNNTSLGSYYFAGNGTYNFSISAKPGSLTVTVTGHYSVSQLIGYLSGYLSRAGLL